MSHFFVFFFFFLNCYHYFFGSSIKFINSSHWINKARIKKKAGKKSIHANESNVITRETVITTPIQNLKLFKSQETKEWTLTGVKAQSFVSQTNVLSWSLCFIFENPPTTPSTPPRNFLQIDNFDFEYWLSLSLLLLNIEPVAFGIVILFLSKVASAKIRCTDCSVNKHVWEFVGFADVVDFLAQWSWKGWFWFCDWWRDWFRFSLVTNNGFVLHLLVEKDRPNLFEEMKMRPIVFLDKDKIDDYWKLKVKWKNSTHSETFPAKCILQKQNLKNLTVPKQENVLSECFNTNDDMDIKKEKKLVGNLKHKAQIALSELKDWDFGRERIVAWSSWVMCIPTKKRINWDWSWKEMKLELFIK